MVFAVGGIVNLKFSRTAALVVAGIGAVLLLGWVVTTQGPLAPVKVTVAQVRAGTACATQFGIGTVEARRSYAIGPTLAGRVARVLVDQGDMVRLASCSPKWIRSISMSALPAAARGGAGGAADRAPPKPQLAEAPSRAQVARRSRAATPELRSQVSSARKPPTPRRTKRPPRRPPSMRRPRPRRCAARPRTRSGRSRGRRQAARPSRLVSPVDGVVSARLAEPGSTVVAGQAVVQVIDPATLWLRVRIDQGRSGGLRVGLPAEIVLRSDPGRVATEGELQRVDSVSDAVTEERIVNVGFAVAAGRHRDR